LQAEVVGGLESALEDIFGGFGEEDVRGAMFAPTPVDREENFGEILDEKLLLLGIEQQIAVAFLDVGESGEDAAADAKIGSSEVRALLGVGEAEGDAAEVRRVHGVGIVAKWSESGKRRK